MGAIRGNCCSDIPKSFACALIASIVNLKLVEKISAPKHWWSFQFMQFCSFCAVFTVLLQNIMIIPPNSDDATECNAHSKRKRCFVLWTVQIAYVHYTVRARCILHGTCCLDTFYLALKGSYIMSDTANKIILGVSTGLGLLAAGFALKAGINCRNCKVSFKTL